LSTGVDAQTCRVIALDREVGSMTEFKQIVGRGTRIHEDTKTFYFTLLDFRKATNHFADPEFDDEPVQIYEPGPDDPISPPDVSPSDDGEPIPPVPGDDETIVDVQLPPWGGPDQPPRKVYVDNVPVSIVAERIEHLDAQGRLVTESLRDFTKTTVRKRFASLDAFLTRWRSAERKQAVIEELGRRSDRRPPA
jgi:type I restriction enzyme R subunit